MEKIASTAAEAMMEPLLRGIADALRQFETNCNAFLASGDAEALHQLRVALRRLRCAFSIFNASAGKKPGTGRIRDLRAQARRIGAATGQVRKCDVLLVRIGEEFPSGAAREQVAGLTYVLLQVRAQGEAEARGVLEIAAVDLLREGREFLVAQAGLVHGMDARKIVSRLRRKALRRGRKFTRMGDEERHALRIAIKKLRYGAEFFEDEFSRKKRYAKFVKRMGRLQELLGAHNDFGEAGALLASLPDAPELVVAKGEIMQVLRNCDADAAKHLSPAWKKFRRAKPF